MQLTAKKVLLSYGSSRSFVDIANDQKLFDQMNNFWTLDKQQNAVVLAAMASTKSITVSRL